MAKRWVSGDKVRLKKAHSFEGEVNGSTPEEAFVDFAGCSLFGWYRHEELEEVPADIIIGVDIPDAVTGEPRKAGLFIDVAKLGDHTLSIRSDLCVVSGGVATFPNSPLNTLIAAARTLCDNVETVGTHNRIDTEHIDKLRQALDGL